MEITGRDSQVVALAVTVKGDVTSAPFKGVATKIPEVNFAVTEAGGAEHPMIANAMNRPESLNKAGTLEGNNEPFCFPAIDREEAPGLAAAGHVGIRTISHFRARVRIRAPNYELDRGVKRKPNRLKSSETLVNATREADLHSCQGLTYTH